MESNVPSESNNKGSNLLYLNNPLDHITNTYSGYLISNNFSTKKNNIKYGFIFEYTSNDYYLNHAEIAIDFYDNQTQNIKEFNRILEFQKVIFIKIFKEKMLIY